MGEKRARNLGDAYEGESEFRAEDDLASLEQAFEAAAEVAARSIEGRRESGELDDDACDQEYNRPYDTQIEVVVRRHNQHVKVYRVRITPGG